MRRNLATSLLLVLVIGVPSWGVEEPKGLTLKVLVPQEDAIVKVNQKEIEGAGTDRRITIKEPVKGKAYHTVTAIWEPNNYTKFTRTRKVPVDTKSNLVVVDFNKAYDTEKIKIRYVPTPEDVVAKMCQLGKVTKNDVVFDLGCGDGRLVIQAVQDFAQSAASASTSTPSASRNPSKTPRTTRSRTRSPSASATCSTSRTSPKPASSYFTWATTSTSASGPFCKKRSSRAAASSRTASSWATGNRRGRKPSQPRMGTSMTCICG